MKRFRFASVIFAAAFALSIAAAASAAPSSSEPIYCGPGHYHDPIGSVCWCQMTAHHHDPLCGG